MGFYCLMCDAWCHKGLCNKKKGERYKVEKDIRENDHWSVLRGGVEFFFFFLHLMNFISGCDPAVVS